MIKAPLLSRIAALMLLATAQPAFAQFTVSTATTTAQTLPSGATGTVTSTGSITVGNSTQVVGMSGTATTLSNSGLIKQTNNSGRGVLADGTNLVIQNNLGGTIQTSAGDAVRSSTATTSISLTNVGTIEVLAGSGGQAIDWGNLTGGNANSITNSGTIKATGEDAVRPGKNGTINNSGIILAVPVSGSGSDGIQADSTGVQVTNSGAISGRHGITGGTNSFLISVTNNVGGTINGVSGSAINIDGTNATSAATVTNYGTLTGTSTTSDSDGIDVDGTLTLNNYGIIRSLDAAGAGNNSEGLAIGGGTVVNYAGAEISGQIVTGAATGVGRGITVNDSNGGPAFSATSIDNSGLIRGYSGSAINLNSSFANMIANQAGGVIRGGGSEAVVQIGSGNDTLINSGTIQADGSGKAIDLGTGNNLLKIIGGLASITGDVSGGTGSTSSLVIDAGVGNTFGYSGAFSNFNSAEIKSGTARLFGASTYSGATTITGGTLFARNSTGSATGTGAVTLKNLATLGGDGRIGGGVSVEAGGRIAPGEGAGTLTLLGNLNLVDASRFLFDLGANAAASDLLTIDGALLFTGSGSAVFDFMNNGVGLGTYTLLNFGSSSGVDLTKFTLGTHDGFTGNFVLGSNSLSLVVTAVPEPSTTAAILGLTVFFGVLVLRTRARKVGGAQESFL